MSSRSSCRRNSFLRRIFVPIFTFGLLLYIIVYLWQFAYTDVDRNIIRHQLEEMIHNKASKQACKQPNLPVFSQEMMNFVRYVPPIDCSKATPNWVTCENYECHISHDIIMQKGPITCSFTDIIRLGDSRFSEGDTKKSDSMYRMEASDVVKVDCHAANDAWNGVLTTTRYDQHVWDRTGWEYTDEEGLKMNVLIFAIDSISRNTMIRKLPKTYKYLTEQLGALVLEGYNIIGDGTPQALTPMLTGKTELELPETRKRVKGASYVDIYPFIWNDYRKNGYVTGYLEEGADIGTYTFRLKGFNVQPTDHYGRTYYLSSAGFFKKSPQMCAGSTPKHKVMLDFVKSFFNVYKSRPKFMFAFQADLSHDNYNLIGAADLDYVDFLQSLHNSGALNNTLLITMADHGHRFAEIRNTFQGKLEERLPFFSFTFPPWFKTKYKRAYDNFKGNLKTLVTPFDIHATLKSVLHLGSLEKANLSERSLSLFSHIPQERGCAQAFIEPHWCACLDWQPVDLTLPVVERLAAAFTNILNNYTSVVRNQCETLSIGSVFWVNKLTPNDNLIKFKNSKDNDGFVPDLTGNTQISTMLYQIKLKLFPGAGIFEATLIHNLDQDVFTVKEEDISRINVYGTQPWCIATTHPNLRKFCYCKQQN
ncbi:uncharacterized protein [Atheta coriaria]|uniref:uncharacterized protein n=1 Tax=Dalotia coriaria TaxID=877792 RepID=UPI0031F462FD